MNHVCIESNIYGAFDWFNIIFGHYKFHIHDKGSLLNSDSYKELFEIHYSRCSLEIQNHYKSTQNKFSGSSKIV